MPLQKEVIGNSAMMLIVLLSAVSVVLFIACLNIASLLLARSAVRQQEIAIRQAIGAGDVSARSGDVADPHCVSAARREEHEGDEHKDVRSEQHKAPDLRRRQTRRQRYRQARRRSSGRCAG